MARFRRRRFVHKESDKHLRAKKQIYAWFDQGTISDIQYDSVHMEYPLCRDGAHHGMTYAECKRLGIRPIKVADIAVFYDGSIKCLIEVVHTHQVDFKAQKQLMDYYPELNVYEIDADKVLRISTPPRSLLNHCKLLW